MAITGRSKVVRAQPHHIQSFGTHLSSHVFDVSNVLKELFSSILNGHISGQSQKLTIDLFTDWCKNTDVVTFDTALQSTKTTLIPLIRDRIAGKPIEDNLLQKAIKTLKENTGFDKDEIRAYVVRLINETVQAKSKGTDIDQAFLNSFLNCRGILYEKPISTFCVQTAHVIIARIVLYRVGEDKKIFPAKLSGKGLKNHRTHPQTITFASNTALALIESVRLDMEKLLAAVYEHTEFDWWYVPDVYRGIPAEEVALLESSETKLNALFSQLLDVLSGFDLGGIDKDVWKDVYQYYLDEETRQRLGGFYTPDELSGLALDLIGYKSTMKELCRKRIFDPSCGSGTFTIEAAFRLIDHLTKKMSCHNDVHDPSQATWIRKKKVLDYVTSCIYGNDIHPFAQFLTTVNLFFLALSYFIEVRKYEPRYSLDFNIGCFDTLRYEADATALDQLYNSRLKTAEVRRRRHSDLLKIRFDFVVGNPPWGGILKGKLSPLYGEQKRTLYKTLFDSADGKYDIYVLFLERGVKWLIDEGKLGFVTPTSYLDKDFGKETRRFLSANTRLDYFIDVGDVGRTFFPDAMNTPAVNIFSNKEKQDAFIVTKIFSEANNISGSLSDKRKKIVKMVNKTVSRHLQTRKSITEKYVSTFQLPSAVIAKGEKDPWIFHPLFTVKAEIQSKFPISVSQLLDTMQGITIGGEGCLDIYLMDTNAKTEHEFEDEITLPVIKGKEISRWKYEWEGNWTIYPYLDNAAGNEIRQVPAFTVDNQMSGYQIEDSLDFRGVPRDAIAGELNQRIAQGLVKFPNVAKYLVSHYDTIADRELDGKAITSTGKKWYEYHRPRERRKMLIRNKIIVGKYADSVKFAYEQLGHIGQDSVFIMVPSQSEEWNKLHDSISGCLGKEASEEDCLYYILGVINSEIGDLMLKLGKNKTVKGDFSVTDQVFDDLRVPRPQSRNIDRKRVKQIILLVKKLVSEVKPKSISAIEKRLNAHIFQLFEIDESTKKKIVSHNKNR